MLPSGMSSAVEHAEQRALGVVLDVALPQFHVAVEARAGRVVSSSQRYPDQHTEL